ncbi:demethylmenaquinone methyltransferase [Phtheirospermum japonicum]|uniref:Demethylmenaquinone methyltransferase n=1 Tax=Phtheirospermum japonicum TaxID=374723 RepID=A0A830CLM9_9LAMI|nr:demethylmenaquinone methyltransferase [Phtheirospermum japonicum]
MAKTKREWTQIYAIYGVDDWQTPLFLFIHAVAFSILSVSFLLYFEPACYFLQRFILPGPASARFVAGFTGSVTALSAVCLFFAAASFFYSAVALHWEMSQRMVSAVPDWSSVKYALDLGCAGRGVLLNAVALQLKKSGSSGRVVGLKPTRSLAENRTIDPTCILRTAGLEGVQKYVTCRPGDPRTLPFSDGYFDVVVSAVFLHTVGKEFGPRSAAAAAERMKVLVEVVRVLKPGGVAVVWDLVHAPEYARRLDEMKMEDVTVSERVTAFLVSSHIVSFRKPRQHFVGSDEVALEWSLGQFRLT